MPQQTPLRTGDPRRVGRYRLAGRIAGIPADGPIYLGISPEDAEVAISMLRTDWAQDAAARDRFAAEAAVAKRVPPFCAARVLDAGLESYEAYLVSEYVPGPSLLEVISADGVMGGPDLEAVAIGMATGLASVHQAGLVHGNFGPEYVIIASDGAPRVVEFGITPPYGTATPAGDMLAWARTVVFAATGRPPASHWDLAVLPRRLGELTARCLDPDPGERPAARSALLALLGNVDLPAGVLAEGMRRATRSGSSGPDGSPPPTRHRHSGLGPGPAKPAPPRGTSARAARGGPAHGGPAHGGPAHGGPAHGGPGHAPAPPLRPAPGRPATARSGSGRPATASTGQRQHPPQREAGRGRTAWLAGAAVVVVVVAGAAVFHLLQDNGSSGGKSAGTAATVGPASSHRPNASTSPRPGPTATATTPASFAGTWAGIVRQPPTDAYHVSITLKPRSGQGTVSYSGTAVGCSGILVLKQATPARLTMIQNVTSGSCENGDVTISATGGGAVWFSFRSAGPVAAGKLTRS